MAYQMRSNPGYRLGIYADDIEVVPEQCGLTPAGCRQDGTDAAGADKETALAELYRRACVRCPSGIGGPVPDRDSMAEGGKCDE